MNRREIEAVLRGHRPAAVPPPVRKPTPAACSILIYGAGARQSAEAYLQVLSHVGFNVALVPAGREYALKLTDGIVIAFYEGDDPYRIKFHSAHADMVAVCDGSATFIEICNARALKVLRPKVFGL